MVLSLALIPAFSPLSRQSFAKADGEKENHSRIRNRAMRCPLLGERKQVREVVNTNLWRARVESINSLILGYEQALLEHVIDHIRCGNWLLVGIVALCCAGCNDSRKLAAIPDYVPKTLYSLSDHDQLTDSASVMLSFGKTSITQVVFQSTGVETSVLNVVTVLLPTKDGYPIRLVHEPGRYIELN